MKPSKRRDMLIEHAEKARISRKLVDCCATTRRCRCRSRTLGAARAGPRRSWRPGCSRRGSAARSRGSGLDGPAAVAGRADGRTAAAAAAAKPISASTRAADRARLRAV